VPGDVEGGSEVGEGVPGPELPAGLLEVEADDGKERRRGDCREQQRVGEPVAGEKGNEIGDGHGPEHPRPREVGNQQRILGSEPRAKRRRQRRPHLGHGRECRGERLAFGETSFRVAGEAAVDRRAERGW
jgi:hypothetical protein